jgi:uncharacterized protein with von Willebrand factor type A (vWA) domain
VVFDTAIVDLTGDARRPGRGAVRHAVLGGGTDINRALAYAQSLITKPRDTILVLITDLYEGGSAEQMLRRVAALSRTACR